jgi:hypothetical protein
MIVNTYTATRLHSEISITLPREIKDGRAWLESLLANAHCLYECETIRISHRFGMLMSPIKEKIDKFKPLVKIVRINHWNRLEYY